MAKAKSNRIMEYDIYLFGFDRGAKKWWSSGKKERKTLCFYEDKPGFLNIISVVIIFNTHKNTLSSLSSCFLTGTGKAFMKETDYNFLL